MENQRGQRVTCDYQKLDKKNEQLRTNPAQVERILLPRLSGKAKALLRQAFQLSTAALAEEPAEWPTQILACLQAVAGSAAQRIRQAVVESGEDCRLKPIRTPLIAAGGPITAIVKVGAPTDQNKALVWSSNRKTITSFRDSSFRTWELSSGLEVGRLDLPIEWGSAAISDPPRSAVVVAVQRQLLLVNLEGRDRGIDFYWPCHRIGRHLRRWRLGSDNRGPFGLGLPRTQLERASDDSPFRFEAEILRTSVDGASCGDYRPGAECGRQVSCYGFA